MDILIIDTWCFAYYDCRMTLTINRTSKYARIVGTGSCLPHRRVANEELIAQLAAQGIASSNEWIVARTGIKARHFADPSVSSSMLGAEACRRALGAAGLLASDIDLIICATSTPDQVFPSTACLIQAAIGAGPCPAFDVQAVCSGFIYALTVADAMIRGGGFRCALVVGAEVFSRLLDFKDRSTCVLFGDGAGAVVLAASPRVQVCSQGVGGRCSASARGRESECLGD